MDRPPILGTRGSPLALAQARKVAAALEAAHRWPAGYVAHRPDQDQRRPRSRTGRWPRSAARRCGPRSSTGPARRRGRFLRPFDEGCRKRAAAGDPHRRDAAARRRPRPADRRRFDRRAAAGRGRRHLVAAPRRAAAAAPARPQDRAAPRQCRNPAGQGRRGRGRRDLARRRRARPARACTTSASAIPVEVLLPAPGQAAIGIECRTDDTMTQSVLTTVNHADHLSPR